MLAVPLLENRAPAPVRFPKAARVLGIATLLLAAVFLLIGTIPPVYSAPLGVTAAHALALAATGMMCFIYLVAIFGPSQRGVFMVVFSPFVLALPLALQLGMPEWIFHIDVFVCITAAGFFLILLCSRYSSDREESFIFGSASLALLVTALNALLPAAAVYTLLPLVWAVGSGFAISGWLAYEKERVMSSCERFFGLALTVVRSMVTLPLAVLPWVEAMPGRLFDALWFACAAMALLHLSMAFLAERRQAAHRRGMGELGGDGAGADGASALAGSRHSGPACGMGKNGRRGPSASPFSALPIPASASSLHSSAACAPASCT